MLQRVLGAERIGAAELGRHLGVTRQAVAMKLAGKRPWKAEEMSSIKAFLREETGREYTVDELFFAEEEGAA